MAGVRGTPEEATQKWLSRLQAATPQIQQGVARVSEAPGAKAARNADLWQRRVTESRDKWVRNVSRVSVGEWQDRMQTVGIPRIAQGAQAKQDKFTSFAREFFPYLDQGVRQIANMPKGGVENGINRAAAMIRHNAQFRRQGGISGGGGAAQ